CRYCGSAIVDSGETCDDGPGGVCPDDCAASSCGDGILDPDGADNVTPSPDDEACDDGNNVSGYTDPDCSGTCASLAECGDGTPDVGEECDDGDTDNTNACTNACTNAACGDGIRRTDITMGTPGFEECDDGNNDAQDLCKNDCAFNTVAQGPPFNI